MGPMGSVGSVSATYAKCRTLPNVLLPWAQVEQWAALCCHGNNPLTMEAILALSGIADFVSEHVNVSFPVIKSVLVEFWQ